MKRVAITYVLFTFLGLALLSCKKDDNTTPSPKVNTFEAIEDIATFHGNFDGENIEDINMARLAASLGYNRYTERLNSINDLSKVIYVYGNRDEQVGPLSAEEVDFLKGKNAKVELSVSGTHGSAIDVGLRLLKETFGIK